MIFRLFGLMGICVSLAATASDTINVYEFTTTSSFKCRIETSNALGTMTCVSAKNAKHGFTADNLTAIVSSNSITIGAPNMGPEDEEYWWENTYVRNYAPAQVALEGMAMLGKIKIDRLEDVASITIHLTSKDDALVSYVHRQSNSARIAIKELQLKGDVLKTRMTQKK